MVEKLIIIGSGPAGYTAAIYANRDIKGNEDNLENAEVERKIAPEPKTPPEELWIRSACPNCGNVEYKINDDMSLECTKCGQRLDSDYTGPYNIIISNVLGRRQP